MSLHTQKWSAEVQKELFESISYINNSKAFQDMQAVSQFTIPNSGAITAGVDDYVRPLTPGQRTDSETVIAMAGLKVDPFYVKLDEQWSLAYDKRADITSGIANALADDMAQRVYHSWLASADMSKSVKTTGAATASKPADAVGTRKKLTYSDILDANEILDLQNVPAAGRVLSVHPSMVKDIKKLTEFNNSDQISTELLKTGTIGMIDGLKVVVAIAPNVLVDAVASGDTAEALGYGVTGTTESYFAAVFHPDFVCRVVGQTQVFVNMADATYTSDVISSTQRVGGGLVRNDKKGYVAIVQEIG